MLLAPWKRLGVTSGKVCISVCIPLRGRLEEFRLRHLHWTQKLIKPNRFSDTAICRSLLAEAALCNVTNCLTQKNGG